MDIAKDFWMVARTLGRCAATAALWTRDVVLNANPELLVAAVVAALVITLALLVAR